MGNRVKKKGKMEIQKSEYLENEKSFLIETKSIFHSFGRAIIWWEIKIWEKIADTSFKNTDKLIFICLKKVQRISTKETCCTFYSFSIHLLSYRESIVLEYLNVVKVAHAFNFNRENIMKEISSKFRLYDFLYGYLMLFLLWHCSKHEVSS